MSPTSQMPVLQSGIYLFGLKFLKIIDTKNGKGISPCPPFWKVLNSIHLMLWQYSFFHWFLTAQAELSM